jgi:hypothetical protein
MELEKEKLGYRGFALMIQILKNDYDKYMYDNYYSIGTDDNLMRVGN